MEEYETHKETSSSPAASLYLDLLKRCLTRTLFEESRSDGFRYPDRLSSILLRLVSKPGLDNLALRREGRIWPAQAETMIGLARLDNLQNCVADILRNNIPGDLIEAGVWRGGACIFMRAILKAYADRNRIVWVADSFQGLPRPDSRYPQDAGDELWKHSDVLGVSLDRVKENFARYGLLDSQVRFIEGWFNDTLPAAPIHRLAVLRLDGDMYASTMDALVNLYPKLSSGGYAIIDDYGAIPACRQAVTTYRAQHGIQDRIEQVDWTGVYWRKGGH